MKEFIVVGVIVAFVLVVVLLVRRSRKKVADEGAPGRVAPPDRKFPIP